MESKRIGEEIEILLGTQTIKEKSLAQKFKSNDAVKVITLIRLKYSHIYLGILRFPNQRKVSNQAVHQASLQKNNKRSYTGASRRLLIS